MARPKIFAKYITYDNMQVSDSFVFGSALPLIPLIAPASFNPSAQAVNIFDIFNFYDDVEKAYIYQFSDTVNTLTLSAGSGLSYRYGYTRVGVDFISTKIASITNPFTAGDTKRWVMGYGTSIISNPFQSLTNGLLWVYMHRVNDFRLGAKSVLKYVHITNSALVTPTSNQSPYAFTSCAALSGILTIPTYWTSIPYQFANSAGSGLNGQLLIHSNILSIDYAAFNACAGFTSLVINEGLTNIGESSFSGLSGLTGSLSFPNSLTSLGLNAFSSCPAAVTGSITLSNNVTTIGAQAFLSCVGLNGTFAFGNNVAVGGMASIISDTLLTFAAHNSTNYEVVSNVLYGKVGGAKTLLLSSPKTKSGSLVIETTTTTISTLCFFKCTLITGDLSIPISVTTIGANAFFGCTGFTSLTLPLGYNLPQTGGNWAFSFSSNFSAVSLNQSILNINSGGNLTRTLAIGATNKARLLASFPTAETDANARGITII